MGFYEFFTFVVVLYCVVRALSAKQNPIFWGIFAFLLPWLAIFVIHVFTWNIGDKKEKPKANKNRQDSWERIREELKERNKRQQNRQAFQRPEIKKEQTYNLPPKKPSKQQALPEFEIPTIDPIGVDSPEEIEVLPIEEVAPPKIDAIEIADIEVPEFVESEKLPAPEITDTEEVLELEPIKEELVLDPITSDESKVLKSEAVEEILPLLDAIKEEQEEKEENADEGVLEGPLQAINCQIQSYKRSPSGMHKIKYTKACGQCEWEDNKQFSFYFHESETIKKDDFICPNCLEKNDLTILVRLKEEEEPLIS